MRIAIPLAGLVAFTLVASLGYYLIERDFTLLESLYMAVITIATVGYEEVHPLSHWGRMWTIFVIAGGVVTVAVTFSLIGAMVVEGRLRSVFGRKHLERKIDGLTGHVVVCGYGRTGSMISAELAAAGRSVVVVDIDPERTETAGRAGLLYVLGDAQDEAALRDAGVERAADLVTVMPTDAENVFVTLSARGLNPAMRIIARAQQAASQDKLLKAGASRVVCPTVIGAVRMADVVLRPAVVDFFDVAHTGVDLEMDQLELAAESGLVGKTLAELALPRRIGVHVVAVRRADGKAVYTPTPDMKLAAGDTLILVGRRGAAAAVQKLQLEAAGPTSAG